LETNLYEAILRYKLLNGDNKVAYQNMTNVNYSTHLSPQTLITEPGSEMFPSSRPDVVTPHLQVDVLIGICLEATSDTPCIFSFESLHQQL
jgi:hypothetical protein